METRPFHLATTPLEGTHLIEAGAGTGKTYTITGLYLRLILEKGLGVEQILVVTFTEAATEELKDRIRTMLRQALDAFLSGSRAHGFLDELWATIPDPAGARTRLLEAIRTFDQAAIHTIHGFCARMLHENAFESANPFDTALLPDQEDLKQEIVEDFWRLHLTRASPLFVRFALANGLTPASLLALLSNRTGQPFLRVLPRVPIPDTSPEEKAYRTAFSDIEKVWPQAREDIERILSTDKGLSRVKYGLHKIPLWIKAMDLYIASGGEASSLFQGFEKFTAGVIQEATKKGHVPPFHPFFEQCETLKDREEAMAAGFQRRVLGLKVALFDYARAELARRKEEKNLLSFDDLLLRMHHALKAPTGVSLARAIRRKFKAALIDEFQDTDPLQYAIFHKVFGSKKGLLFLIGDPKQAIYGFRGADIFAYLKAKSRIPEPYSLQENWRSEKGLIAAVNTLFSTPERPFVYEDIPYHGVIPARGKKQETLSLHGRTPPALTLWFVEPQGEPSKAITKEQATPLITKAVAGEISSLLASARDHQTLLGGRPLREKDIAVLTRKNKDAQDIQKALSVLHIPSVLYSTGNLFDTAEALEMERVLSAIAEPRDEGRLKAALCTPMLGVKGEEMERLLEDADRWERWITTFEGYRILWYNQGFIPMFRQFLVHEEILPRLMSIPYGERRCTNLLHLSEVLQHVSLQKRSGMGRLIKWLAEQRDPRTRRREEHQLRLESDANAVKILTIHKSKGLEFPVVFCPFAWEGARIRRKTDPFTFHDQGHHMTLTLDLGSENRDRNRRQAEKEWLSENLRLLYVALTRAENLAYLVWGRFNEAETSAPAYLLHKPDVWKEDHMVQALGRAFKKLEDETLRRDLASLTTRAQGSIRVSSLPLESGRPMSPHPEKAPELASRPFRGAINRSWRISSFSSLIADRPHLAEWADRDTRAADRTEEPGLVMDEGTPRDIFTFPKGTKAGTCLHEIMEHLDFTETDEGPIRDVVADRLGAYGYDLEWVQAVRAMLRRVLSAPLDPRHKGLRLARISTRSRLNELEFTFPLKKVTLQGLQHLFGQETGPGIHGLSEEMDRLRLSPTRGFMRGYMDLVFEWEGRFFLVDWKSNFLGHRLEDYHPEALAVVMKEEFYILQYTLYTLALDQYLRQRLPGYRYEEHFGGVYYIFLRGVDPERDPSCGIYRALPSPSFLASLRKALLDHRP